MVDSVMDIMDRKDVAKDAPIMGVTDILADANIVKVLIAYTYGLPVLNSGLGG